MKKQMNYIAGILFIGSCVLSACSDDFLQTDSPNQPSQSTYWQTESDALMALTACYDAMQSDHLYDDNVDGGGFGFLMRPYLGCLDEREYHFHVYVIYDRRLFYQLLEGQL